MAATGGAQRKGGAFLSYVHVGVQGLVALAYTPVLLRLLGQEEYGLYMLVGSLVGYLSLLSFGLGAAYLRFSSRYREQGERSELARLNAVFLLMLSGASILALSLGVAYVLGLEFILGNQFGETEVSLARRLSIPLLISVCIGLPGTLFTSYLFSRERFYFLKGLMLAQSLAFPALSLALLAAGAGSLGLTVASALINIGGNLLTVWFATMRLGMKFRFDGLRWGVVAEVLVFSGWVFVNMLVDLVNMSADRVILARLHGPAPVAAYTVGTQFSIIFTSLSIGISTVFAPQAHRLVARAAGVGELNELFRRVGRYQFMVLFPFLVGFAVFGQQFIALWAGESYGESYWIAFVIMCALTVPLIQNLGIEIQQALNRHVFRSVSYAAVAAINILVSIPLAAAFGGIGAAAGTAAALLFGNGAIMNLYYHRRIGLDVIRFWKCTVCLTLNMTPLVLTALGLAYFMDTVSPSSLTVALLLYVLASVAWVWLAVLSRSERVRLSASMPQWRR